MKSVLAIFALAFSFSTFAAEVQLNVRSTMTLKKVEGKEVFEKINGVAISDLAIITSRGVERKTSKNVDNGKITLSVEKSLVKVEDEKNGVYAEIVSSVDRSIFGRVKSFTISGENLENAYFTVLQKKGLIAFANLDRKANERKSLIVGDQVCVVDKSNELATCEQDVSIKVDNNEYTLTAALFVISLNL